MQNNLSQTLQPSLEAPPVYRRFLGGGTETLRLSGFQVAVLVGLGVLVSLLSTMFVDSRPLWQAVSCGTAATIAALVTAMIAARWLGSRKGFFSGCLYLLSGYTLSATTSPSENWLAAVAVIAVAAFAFANVAGRLPLVSGRWPARSFYVFTAAIFYFSGPMTASAVVLLCFLVLAAGQNCRGLRFFFDMPGIVVIAVVAMLAWFSPAFASGTVWNTVWPDGSVFSFQAWAELIDRFVYLLVVRIPCFVLPWGPLALIAIFVGIQQGHYSTPFGRFLIVWLLAPLGMALFGLIGQNTAAVFVFPPLSILGGIGLAELLVQLARVRICLQHKSS